MPSADAEQVGVFIHANRLLRRNIDDGESLSVNS